MTGVLPNGLCFQAKNYIAPFLWSCALEELKGVTVPWPAEGRGEGVCMEATLTLEGSAMRAQNTQGGTQPSVCCFIISTEIWLSNTSHKTLYIILTA